MTADPSLVDGWSVCREHVELDYLVRLQPMRVLARFASRHMPARTRVLLNHLIRHAAQARAGIDLTLDRPEP